MANQESPDELHARMLKKISGPTADFIDIVYTGMSPDERAELPATVYSYIKAFTAYALERLPKYGEELAKVVSLEYDESLYGERFMFDPVHGDTLTEALLYIDRDGHLVSVKDPNLEWKPGRKSDKPKILDMNGYRSYKVLTGPQTGATFYPRQRPLQAPVYKPGVIAQWFKTSEQASQEQQPGGALAQQTIPGVVFLCHSSEDKANVRKFYERLLSDAFDPWLDEERILPGQEWNREITRAVKDAAAIVVFLSTRSITKHGYVQKEIKRALDVADEKPEGTIFIIPAKLEPCKVPDRLTHLQWVNMFEDRGYDRLCAALRTTLLEQSP